MAGVAIADDGKLGIEIAIDGLELADALQPVGRQIIGVFLEQKLGPGNTSAGRGLRMLGIAKELLLGAAVKKGRPLAGIDDLPDLFGGHIALRPERGGEIAGGRSHGRAALDLVGIGGLPAGEPAIKDRYIVVTKHLEGPVSARGRAEIGRPDTGRHQHHMAVIRHAEPAGKRLELRRLRQQADHVIAADPPAILQIVGMDRRGDMALEIGVIAAAVDLVAKVDQDQLVIIEMLRQPDAVDKRGRRDRRRHGGDEKGERDERHGHDAANKLFHLGLREMRRPAARV